MKKRLKILYISDQKIQKAISKPIPKKIIDCFYETPLSASQIAEQTNAKAIITITYSGYNTIQTSSYRPTAFIYAFTKDVHSSIIILVF